MRAVIAKIIIAAGRRFGRFAVLLFVIPAAIIFLLWLQLADIHKGWFFGLMFVVIPIVSMAVAFLLGALIAGIGRHKISSVSRQDADGLWQLWTEIAGPKVAQRTKLVLDVKLNAGITFYRPFWGLIGKRIILIVGIPLLKALDRPALKAVLAHEYAHNLHKDTNGSLHLSEFESSFDIVFEHAPPRDTISGMLLFSCLGWLQPSFDREMSRLSRNAELAADNYSAKNGTELAAARALLLASASQAYADHKVFAPLQHELMGSVTVPRPPLARLMPALEQLYSPDNLQIYIAKALQEDAQPQSSHPSLRERLHALGFAETPPIEPVADAVLESMVNPEFAAGILAQSDRNWENRVADALQ